MPESTRYQDEVLADSPVLYLPTDGSMVNAGSGGQAVTTVRTATYVSAPSGQGLGKTGAEAAAYCTIPTPITGTVLTVEIWGRYTGSTYYQDAFACNPSLNHHLMLVNTGNLYLGMWVAGYKGPSRARPTDANWHHFVHVVTSASAQGVSDGLCEQYQDGVYMGSFAHPLDTKVNGVGRIADYSGGYPFGDWADPAIYTTELDPARILAHYEAGVAEDYVGDGTAALSLDATGLAEMAVAGSGTDALALAAAGAGRRSEYDYGGAGWGQPIPTPSAWQAREGDAWNSTTGQDGWT